jgi:hypothetical protein
MKANATDKLTMTSLRKYKYFKLIIIISLTRSGTRARMSSRSDWRDDRRAQAQGWRLNGRRNELASRRWGRGRRRSCACSAEALSHAAGWPDICRITPQVRVLDQRHASQQRATAQAPGSTSAPPTDDGTSPPRSLRRCHRTRKVRRFRSLSLHPIAFGRFSEARVIGVRS